MNDWKETYSMQTKNFKSGMIKEELKTMNDKENSSRFIVNRLYFTVIFLFCSTAVFSQSVRILARPVKDSNCIRLRWAPTAAAIWKTCNTYGFILERYVVSRDKQALEQPERQLLSTKPFKPAPLEQWEALANEDQYAAVIAQALYGKDFQISANDQKGVAKIINQSQELEQRFVFSLYAADMSYEGALKAGWAFTDRDIKPNERYFYRIKPATPANILKPDSSGILISMAEAEELPAINDIGAVFGDKTVMLTWDAAFLSNYYISYYLEKSTDGGKTFNRLPGAPISNLNNSPEKPTTRLYYIDSLQDNSTLYQYRIIGINPFGETGPPSKMVEGHGQQELAYVPNITRYYIDDKGMLQIQWEFDEKGNALIQGFTLSRSDKENGTYSPILQNIPPTQRKLSYNQQDGSGYYTITAEAKEGSRTSFPVLVQAIDTIAPSVPTGVTAVIDSAGIVTLRWKPNTEKDLMGYKVFRALKADEEPVPLIDSVWYVNKFTDTLSLKLSNPKAWYAVSALDRRFNQSALCPLVEVKKPLKIPPSPAVIARYQVNMDTVSINWINSTDEDIITHTLWRKSTVDTVWNAIKEFPGRTVNTFSDNGLQAGVQYVYAIEAKNEAGLITRSEPLPVTIAYSGKKETLTRLYAIAHPDKKNIEVSWDDKLKEVQSYQVYKATGESGFSLWKTVSAGNKGLYDTDVQPNTAYKYAVQPVMNSGAYGEMKTVSVRY